MSTRSSTQPSHPYTRGAAQIDSARRGRPRPALPVPARSRSRAPSSRLRLPPRCPLRIERCATERPPPSPFGPTHHAACWVTGEAASAVAAPCARRGACAMIASIADEPLIRASGLAKISRARLASASARSGATCAPWTAFHFDSRGKGRRWPWSANPGCGKSTLGRLMLRLIEPSAGSVSYRRNGPRRRFRRRRCGPCGATCR